MRYPTERVIATKTWYPEMLEYIQKHWNVEFEWSDYIKLCKKLNKILKKIREKNSLKPATFFCKNCNDRVSSKFSEVTVSGLLYTLIKYKFIEEPAGKKLLNKWKTYKKNNNLDLKGCIKKETK